MAHVDLNTHSAGDASKLYANVMNARLAVTSLLKIDPALWPYQQRSVEVTRAARRSAGLSRAVSSFA
jgi:hypothetical protein